VQGCNGWEALRGVQTELRLASETTMVSTGPNAWEPGAGAQAGAVAYPVTGRSGTCPCGSYSGTGHLFG
jgi:hypothetical protein